MRALVYIPAMKTGRGVIVSLSLVDGVGDIQLEDGTMLRFGATALRKNGFTSGWDVGSAVEVRASGPGWGGVERATDVVLIGAGAADDASSKEVRQWAELPDTFSDAASVVVPCSVVAPRPVLDRHPLFDHWRDELIRTAPTVVPLSIAATGGASPGPGDSFAQGCVAWLEEPTWPTCGRCGGGLQLCIQIAPSAVGLFVPGGRGVVAFFCFVCGTAQPDDPAVGWARLLTPRHRVEGTPRFVDANDRALHASTKLVTPGTPFAQLPSASWYRHRFERTRTGAQELLLSDGVEWEGLPEEVEPDMLDDVGAELDDWLEGRPPPPGGFPHWGGAQLGGVPGWDQADDTPSCPHGEMGHLLEYEGGQFLDGALHVFLCRRGACHPAFVAEF